MSRYLVTVEFRVDADNPAEAILAVAGADEDMATMYTTEKCVCGMFHSNDALLYRSAKELN